MNKSCSNEQQNIENYVYPFIVQQTSCDLERNPVVELSNGVIVKPDFYSEDDQIVCELFAHIGTIKAGQSKKISQDLLKMLLIEKCKQKKFRKIIIVVDDEVVRYLSGKSLISESIRQFGFEIMKFDLSEKQRSLILNAQKRQKMV